MNLKNVCLILGAAFSITPCAFSAVIFSDNFDGFGAPVAVTTTSTSGNYNVVVQTAGNNKATFGYDYGTAAGLGIPSAPHSSGGTTLGLRLDPNNGGTAAINSLSVSPITSVTGDVTMTFDLWMNSIAGGAGVTWNGGGTGSSEAITTGFGQNGTTVQNNTSGSGVWFSAVGDGGFAGTSATPDYEARIGSALQATTTGVYAAGTLAGNGGAQDNSNPYYTALFPGQATPAGQTPVATADNGTLLFKWHSVAVQRVGQKVTWFVDGNVMATVSDPASLASGIASIGSWDLGSSQDAGHVFAVVDNLVIVPEPTTGMLLLVGLAGFGIRSRGGRRH